MAYQKGTYPLTSGNTLYTIPLEPAHASEPEVAKAYVINNSTDTNILEITATVTSKSATEIGVTLSEAPNSNNYELIWAVGDQDNTIGLIRSGLELEQIGNQHVWPLQVEAVSLIDNVPSEIFVYHAAMNDDDFMGDIFEVVASVQQLTEIPPHAPGIIDETYQVPYYRKDQLYFHCRHPVEAEDLWDKINEEVHFLVKNWFAMNNLSEQETKAVSVVLPYITND